MRRTSLMVTLLVVVVSAAMALQIPDSLARSKKGKKSKKAEEPAPPPEPVWPSPLDPGLFDGVFKELPFGKVRGEFETVLKARFEAQILPILRATLNASERDGLKAKMEKSYGDVIESFTLLNGSEKGYGVSVVAGEFVSEAGESVYKYAYSDNSAYFFNSDDKLWKLFVCTESAKDFASLLVDLATKYGDPKQIEHQDEEKTIPIAATWRDTTFELRALPPEGIFVCSRLVWTYLPSQAEVDQRRGKAAKKADSGGSADAFLQQVTGGEKDDDPDVLDSIIKKKQKKDD